MVIGTRVVIPTTGGLHGPGIDTSMAVRRELTTANRTNRLTGATTTPTTRRPVSRGGKRGTRRTRRQ